MSNTASFDFYMHFWNTYKL